MAAVVVTADMTIQKNSKIVVNVEEALNDLIVVSFSSEDKNFQGVLLDSNKCNLPFGVYNLHPAFNKGIATTDSNNDKLHSVSQRFVYQEPQYAKQNSQGAKKPGPKGKVQQKMTVRLRPRKVLCSNCKGICNENSENVDVSKKRKLESDDDASTENSESSRVQKKCFMSNTLIPKLSRLQPSEISSAIKGGTKNSKASDRLSHKTIKYEIGEFDKETREVAFVNVSEVELGDKQQNTDEENPFNTLFANAKTLKICFGEGEASVVKIPPIGGDFNEDSGVSCDMNKPASKAAKKAMKKAKKQAKKNNPESPSTETIIGQSPKHLGALSPRNHMDNSVPINDPLEKKHKHKVKHKKKYKNTKKRDENTSKCTDVDSVNYFEDINDHCLNQKLSISLKRLGRNSYERRNDQETEFVSDDCESDVPDFPVSETEGIGGRLLRVSPGDVVWGKVVGFPWWPGRILSVTPTSRANVSWYASNTTSLMPCDSLSPFLEDYKLRFNKKKRGPYKEAVKQATLEAKKHESQLQDPLASPTHPNLAAMSPRPINVFS